MKIWTGGPAFPVLGLQDDEDFNGMTLRDYFAAKALQGMLADPQVRIGGNATAALVENAYEVADAMLAERAK